MATRIEKPKSFKERMDDQRASRDARATSRARAAQDRRDRPMTDAQEHYLRNAVRMQHADRAENFLNALLDRSNPEARAAIVDRAREIAAEVEGARNRRPTQGADNAAGQDRKERDADIRRRIDNMGSTVKVQMAPPNPARRPPQVAGDATTFPIGALVGWIGAQADLAAAITAFDAIGFKLCDNDAGGANNNLGGKFLVGYKAGDSDYGTMRAADGYAVHGGNVNDHKPHKVNHTHPAETTTSSAQVVTGSTCVAVCVDLITAEIIWVDGVTLNAKCDDLIDPIDYWCAEIDDADAVASGDASPYDSGQWTPNHDENIAGHTETDNRPPFVVVAWFVKVE